MKQKIMEREEIGDTFVGNGTILLHVISKKIKQEIGLYLFLQEQKRWHSIYSNHEYKINRVIILCINPQYQAHNFKYLNWATEYNFMNKIGKWQKEELYYL
nr:PTS sugar transporter subunit IIA [Tetragenococcus halophilus]